jgi:hypothetical protein
VLMFLKNVLLENNSPAVKFIVADQEEI